MMHGFPDSLHLYDLLVPLLAQERYVIVFDFLGWGRSDKPADHGFPDSLHLYDLLVPLLAQERYVIVFDFLGWGRSDKPADHRYDVASLRTDLEVIAQSFDLKSIVLVVHDLSGQPGIDWALQNEAQVAALVLLNTYYSRMPGLKPPEAIARFSTPGWWRDVSVWGASRSDWAWQRGVRQQIEKFFVNPAARETFTKIFVHQALGIRPAFFGANAVLREEIAKREQEVARLRQFRKPVRIIFGREDPYLNPSVAHGFQNLFPNSEVFLLEQAGHYVQLDQPRQVAELILAAAMEKKGESGVSSAWRSTPPQCLVSDSRQSSQSHHIPAEGSVRLPVSPRHAPKMPSSPSR